MNHQAASVPYSRPLGVVDRDDHRNRKGGQPQASARGRGPGETDPEERGDGGREALDVARVKSCHVAEESEAREHPHADPGRGGAARAKRCLGVAGKDGGGGGALA